MADYNEEGYLAKSFASSYRKRASKCVAEPWDESADILLSGCLVSWPIPNSLLSAIVKKSVPASLAPERNHRWHYHSFFHSDARQEACDDVGS